MIARSRLASSPLSMTPPLPRADRTLRFHGREILRVTGFLRGKVIHCPDRHVVRPDSIILGDTVLFCDHRPAPGHAQCGACIYLLTIPSRGDEAHRFWLADCTREEMREIQRRGLDAPGIIDYFGGSFDRLASVA